MRRRLGAVLVLVLSAVVGPLPAITPAGATTFAGFAMTADGCVGTSVMFVLPLSRAQSVVPKPFAVYDFAGLGLARATIRTTRCERVRINGGAPAPAAFSSVLIDVNPPKAPGASVHAYELWRVDGRSDLRQRFAEAGMTGDHVDKIAVSEMSPRPLSVVQTVVPWARSSHTIVMAAPDPTSGIPLLNNESAWHKAASGTTFRTLTSSVEAQHAGLSAASVSGDAASLLGFGGALLPGLLRFFSFSAKVEAQPVS